MIFQEPKTIIEEVHSKYHFLFETSSPRLHTLYPSEVDEDGFVVYSTIKGITITRHKSQRGWAYTGDYILFLNFDSKREAFIKFCSTIDLIPQDIKLKERIKQKYPEEFI